MNIKTRRSTYFHKKTPRSDYRHILNLLVETIPYPVGLLTCLLGLSLFHNVKVLFSLSMLKIVAVITFTSLLSNIWENIVLFKRYNKSSIKNTDIYLRRIE